jgi:monoamine oxidase
VTYRNAEVVVIGGGAAGIAAARRLHDAGRDYVLVEARPRLGGRAFTFQAGDYPIDLGCGWLHSADRNPWTEIARRQGHKIDKTPPPWERPSYPIGFPISEQKEFLAALNEFYDRVEHEPLRGSDPPLSHFLRPGCRWNPLINAVSTYFSGAELEHVSTLDMRAYEDSNVNWRVPAGYGSVIVAHARELKVVLNCPVQSVDWSGARLRVRTSSGVLEADAVIVTLSTGVIAHEPGLFDPPLPDKTAAASGLPLGLADKLFLSLEHAEEFEKDSRLFGRTDRTETAIYHLRPLGRPLIECFFGGSCADALEREGDAAFFDFAANELVNLLGSDFRRRLTALPMHRWRADPFARGSYSYARPGKSECRAALASPVDERLYFAGEACSQHSYSTAHGAYLSGVAAAEQLLADHQRAQADSIR